MPLDRDRMKVLAIDTAGPVLGAAIASGPRIVDLIEEDEGFRHVEDLVPRIAELLERAVWAPSDLDAIGVSAGPGSFTGLRVGMATAKGIGLALGIPVYSVGTLEALARQEIAARENASNRPPAAVVAPLLDARKGRVYGAVFDAADGRRLCDDLDVPIEEFVAQLPERAYVEGWVCAGAEAFVAAEAHGALQQISTGRSAAIGVVLGTIAAVGGNAPADGPYAGPTYLRSGDIGTRKRVFNFEGDDRTRSRRLDSKRDR